MAWETIDDINYSGYEARVRGNWSTIREMANTSPWEKVSEERALQTLPTLSDPAESGGIP